MSEPITFAEVALRAHMSMPSTGRSHLTMNGTTNKFPRAANPTLLDTSGAVKCPTRQ
jgi:hypothetical protein